MKRVPKTRAVITGDIVNSMVLLDMGFEGLVNSLWELFGSLKAKRSLVGMITFAGDGFQLVLDDPAEALEMMVLLRCFFIVSREKHFSVRAGGFVPGKGAGPALDVRMALAFGDAGRFNASLTKANGPAFVASGRAVAALKDEKGRMTLLSPASAPAFQPMLSVSALFLDTVMSKYTVSQAEVIFHKLQGAPEKEIASQLGISQPAVNQRSVSADWKALSGAVKIVNEQIRLLP